MKASIGSSFGILHKLLHFSEPFVVWLWLLLVVYLFSSEYFATLRSQSNNYRLFFKVVIVVIGYLSFSMK